MYVCVYICINLLQLCVNLCIYFCTYIYIYIYICVCVCMYIYIYVYIYTCIYIYIYRYMHINTYTRTHILIYVYVCACIYIYTFKHTHAHVHKYLHTYICIDIHRQTYAYMYRCTCRVLRVYIHFLRNFFLAAVVSILSYRFTTWTLTKRTKKKLEWNCAKMLWAILEKYWKEHPTKLQLYGHLSLITKAIKIRRRRHAGYAGEVRTDSEATFSNGLLHTDVQVLGDQLLIY